MSTSPLIQIQPAHLGQTGSDGRIRKAAQQFESVLLGDIFQKLQDNVSSLSGEDSDSSSKSFSELGIQQLATVAARSGGIGISSVVTRYLERESQTADSEPSALKSFNNLPISEMYWQNSEVVPK